MKKFWILGAALALCCTACENDDTQSVKLAWRTFEASIDNDMTRVEFGTPDETTNKIPLSWSDGDKVAVAFAEGAYEGTVSVKNGAATISGEFPEGEPTAAYYPFSAYKDGALTVPTTQTHGQLPVLMSATYASNAFTFSAAESGSGVIRYSFTGAGKSIEGATLTVGETTYTLNIDTPLALSSDVQQICFAVPSTTEAAAYTLRVKTSDGNTYRREKKTHTVAVGSVSDMPIISDMDDTGKYRWLFGTAHEDNSGWFVANYGATNVLNNGDATVRASYTTDYMVKKDGYVTVTTGYNNKQDGSGNYLYSTNIALKGWKNHIFEYYNDGSGYIVGNKSDNNYLVLHAGNYPIVAAKITKLGTIGSGRNIVLDLNSRANKNNNIRYYDGVKKEPTNTGNNNNQYITLVDNADGTSVIYYDFETFHCGKEDDTAFFPSTHTINIDAFTLKVGDIKQKENVAATYDVYWIGTFNTLDELKTYAGVE